MALETVSAKCKNMVTDPADPTGKKLIPAVGADGKALYTDISVSYDFGDDILSIIESVTEPVVLQMFKKGAVQLLQNILRRMHSENKTAEEITAFVATWKPTLQATRIVRPKTDPMEDIVAQWPTLSEEKRAEFLKRLEERTA